MKHVMARDCRPSRSHAQNRIRIKSSLPADDETTHEARALATASLYKRRIVCRTALKGTVPIPTSFACSLERRQPTLER